jgi:hypothetical protein
MLDKQHKALQHFGSRIFSFSIHSMVCHDEAWNRNAIRAVEGA